MSDASLSHLRTYYEILDEVSRRQHAAEMRGEPLNRNEVCLYAGFRQRAALLHQLILRKETGGTERFMGFEIVWVDRDDYCRLA